MATTKEKLNELVFIQSNLKAPKSQTNKFGGYNYRSCEDILEAVKPLLKETNSVLTVSDDIVQVADRIYVKATATIVTPSGTYTNTAFAREALSKKGMDESQVTGAASSYARKYALNGLFAIDDTKDADALNVSKDYVTVSGEAIAASVAVNNSVKLEADLQAKLMPVMLEIAAATTREQLSLIWNNHQDLQTNKAFYDAITKRGKEIAA